MKKFVITVAEAMRMEASQRKYLLGGKGANLVALAELRRLNVPKFLVVSSLALQELACASVQRKQAFAQELKKHVRELAGPDTLWAVRSSAGCEDGSKNSFAGQFQTLLNVREESLADAVMEVYGSLKSPSSAAYAQINGVAADSMAVIVQEMVAAELSGVLFSFDPTRERRKTDCALLTVTRGLGDRLVSGAIDAQTVRLSRSGKVRSILYEQKLLPELGEAGLARLMSNLEEIEKAFNAPQDIEWAMKKGQIFILQARPITSRFEPAIVFDGSNIQESYPGCTSPLTYSFARRAYSGVYRSFMRFMGVPEKLLREKAEVFENLLAYKNGHIYYNLNNWYSLIALLPNYKQSRHMMEKMMGLDSPSELNLDSFAHKDISPFAAWKSGLAIAWNFFLMKRHSDRFFQRASGLQARAAELNSLSYGELVSFYLELERDLLSQWQAPIANDFFAMVFYGLLAGQYEKQSAAADNHYLFNLLLREHGGIFSAQPPRLLRQIAQGLKAASLEESYREAVESNRLEEAIALIFAGESTRVDWLALLERFGDRSIGELKLETKTYRQDPSLLLKIIASLLACEKGAIIEPGEHRKVRENGKEERKERAEKGELSFLSANPLLGWLGYQTREFLARRENMRLVRSQVFGLVRAIVLELGQRLERQGILRKAEDVFYLEIAELLSLNSYDSNGYWAELVELRRARARELAEDSPKRLVQYGLRPALFEPAPEQVPAQGQAQRRILRGLGASVGKVRGRARVINQPEEETMEGYDILVASRTDPGWIVHFAMCRGILTTHGSLLSHTAIVAREMQIPAVVSVPCATEIIETGDLIEIDGASGVVTVLAKACAAPLKVTA